MIDTYLALVFPENAPARVASQNYEEAEIKSCVKKRLTPPLPYDSGPFFAAETRNRASEYEDHAIQHQGGADKTEYAEKNGGAHRAFRPEKTYNGGDRSESRDGKYRYHREDGERRPRDIQHR